MANPGTKCTVLVVCTANICRSPMAEALLKHEFRTRNSTARVHSAGLLALGGPADDLAREVMAARGIDLRSHASKSVTADDISAATLVLAMERAHVAEISAASPNAFSKTFGLTEIVTLGRRLGSRRTNETIETWLARIHGARSPAGVLRAGIDFDIADPHGGSRRGYERCADQLTRLTNALVDLVVPPTLAD